MAAIAAVAAAEETGRRARACCIMGVATPPPAQPVDAGGSRKPFTQWAAAAADNTERELVAGVAEPERET